MHCVRPSWPLVVTRIIASLLIAMLVCLAMPHSAGAQGSGTVVTNETRVRTFVDAFNKRSVDAMMTMVTDDVQWLSVVGDKIVVEAQGKAQLRQGMEAQFKSARVVTSSLEWIHATSSRVAAMERAAWQTATGPKSQASLAVYEFTGDLISKVYYYPVEK